MEPPQKIFMKIEIRDDMRPVDLIVGVRYRPFDFIVAKSGGEGWEIHPSGRFWPTSQCRGMGRPRVGVLGTSRVPLQRSSDRFPWPVAPTMPPRAGSSRLVEFSEGLWNNNIILSLRHRGSVSENIRLQANWKSI